MIESVAQRFYDEFSDVKVGDVIYLNDNTFLINKVNINTVEAYVNQKIIVIDLKELRNIVKLEKLLEKELKVRIENKGE